MTPAAAVALLRECVSGDAEALRAVVADPAVDMAGFVAFAHEHRLAGFVYGRLEQLGVTGVLRPDVLAAAAAGAMLERARTADLVAELGRLHQLLTAIDIPLIYLKGPLLARRFYGDLESRAVADLDLLVHGRDLARAEAALLAAGYAPEFRVLLSRRLSRYFTHHFEYRRGDIPLDLHWVFQRHFTFAIDYPRVWAGAERAELDGRSYSVLSAEYELVLQIIGVLTDLQVGKLALRSVLDIHRILQAMDRTTDWEEFRAVRRRERILRPSAYVLALVLELLRCRAEFPRLAAVIEPMLGALPSIAGGVEAALGSRPLSPGQKLLALRMYETPLPAAVSWWLVSLPFRVAAYGVGRSLSSIQRPRAWRPP